MSPLTYILLTPAVPLTYVVLRMLRPSLWRAIIATDRARQDQQSRGGGRREMTEAKARMRAELEAVPLPRKIVDWLVD